jgi:prepilin-type N-terminal cleavage/methylation domain-containing protein/prepilin-type processing-associated H-X9-DG protein
MQRKRTVSAFTLIELLVVISIIAVLAAILFPVFARARENARRASCLGNLQQIGLGIMQYVQDYDETYPSCTRYLSGTTGTVYYYQEIMPYVKNYEIFRCPSSSAGSGPADSSYDWSGPNYSYVNAGNYGANRVMMRISTDVNSVYVKLSAVASPSTTYLLMDFGILQISPQRVVSPAAASEYLPGVGALGVPLPAGTYDRFVSDFQSGRHFGGVNVLFADGHAKWNKSSEVYSEAKKLTDAGMNNTNKGPTDPIYRTPSRWNPWVDNQ